MPPSRGMLADEHDPKSEWLRSYQTARIAIRVLASTDSEGTLPNARRSAGWQLLSTTDRLPPPDPLPSIGPLRHRLPGFPELAFVGGLSAGL